MTENVTPETLAAAALEQEATPEEFNLADWLVGGTAHRLRERVTIYRDANLAAEVDRVEAEIARAEQIPEGMESMGDSTTGDLEQQKLELLDRMQAAKAEVEIFALIDSELKDAKDALGEKPENYNYSADPGYWYAIFERAAALEGRKLTAGQWETLHATIGAQFSRLVMKYQSAANTDVDARFRRGRAGKR